MAGLQGLIEANCHTGDYRVSKRLNSQGKDFVPKSDFLKSQTFVLWFTVIYLGLLIVVGREETVSIF